MSFPFIGRKKELAILEKLLKKSIASLVVIKGRRRIGKSRLVEEFAKKHTFYRFSGLPPNELTTKQSQLDDFALQLSKQTGLPEITVNDWSKLFNLLSDKITTGRVTVLFDEISWLGSHDPDFLGKLKNAWDIYFKKNPKLILFLCGSVSSWIDKNILSSTGFVGRISLRLTLEELPLEECNEFWLRKNRYISSYEKLKVLSVTGGVPRYLEEIDPTISADENIKDLCFTKTGLLVHEFNDIFTDIFAKRSTHYKKILEQLNDGPKEAKELSELLKVSYTGTFIEYLEDLVKSGFISRDYTWHFSTGKASKLSHFRLSDNYIRFYLKYIEPSLAKIEQDDFTFKSLSSLPGWNSIMGYQFENLVLKNKRIIRDSLNLSSDVIISDNPYFQRTTKKNAGCQIDYLIQTKFGGLYACEIKFSLNPINGQVIKEVQQKIDRLARPKGFSIWPVLIHGNTVQEEVVSSGFFAKIIDFSEFLSTQE